MPAASNSLLPSQKLLHELLHSSVILWEDWESLPEAMRDALLKETDEEKLLTQLQSHQLLTEYQASRARTGRMYGLVLGNYRVLNHVSTGGMGIVFKADHILMRREVAIKVLPLTLAGDAGLRARFLSEMRAVARLHHPNIVAAMDAGRVADPDGRIVHYLVMEYVQGTDLEEMVEKKGKLSPALACNLIQQVASALDEASKHHLVHRDIKPSNVMVTAEMQAKLLDFGLARQFHQSRLTEHGIQLGTPDYMAPEQADDASCVDIRADIYSLGATLYWCLTGQVPFPSDLPRSHDVRQTQRSTPPSARLIRPELSQELDGVISRMMAFRPESRYASPQAVMRALMPFLRDDAQLAMLPGSSVSKSPALASPNRHHRILLVDDEAAGRKLLRLLLDSESVHCEEASNGVEAIEAVRAKPYDLMLLDIDMPLMTGTEVLVRLRKEPPAPHFKIVMFSGRATADEMAQMLLAGADDYLTKPFSVVQLRARIQSALRLKDSQDRLDVLTRHLLASNAELETHLNDRDCDLLHMRNALVLTVAKLVEQGTNETGAHLQRLQRYCRCLGEEAATLPAFSKAIDPNFLQMLQCCVPLHDIGQVALPDHILLKAGKFDADERLIMQTHTTIGAETLQTVAKEHGVAVAFLQMAGYIARHHHERFDGHGYPERLSGEDIPLAARIVSLADVYDALRSRRGYRPAFSHAAAVELILQPNSGQFDPALLPVFANCAQRLDQIRREFEE